MKIKFKIILFIVCIITGGITELNADVIKDGKLVGYGVTNEAGKEYVVIKIESSGNYYFVYEINGSPYCDYLFNMLTNPAFWWENTPGTRFYIVYNNSPLFTSDGKPHYEIQRITWKE
jgi:hypothetical protein